MHAMNEAPTPRLSRVKAGYTTGARSLASRSVTGLARTGITPNALTAAGVTLCLIAAVLVPFESRHMIPFYWRGAGAVVVGSGRALHAGAAARPWRRRARSRPCVARPPTPPGAGATDGEGRHGRGGRGDRLG